MKRIPLIIIVLFSFIQAANMVIPFFNHSDEYGEILIENEENERSCKEDTEPMEWYTFFQQNMLPIGFPYVKNQYLLLDITPSISYLTKPETPPPNIV